MIDSNEGYKTAFRATSIFGGVQLITIIFGIFKSKFTALWLAPSGYGIISLFNSAISLISAISNLGLSSSAVRDISQANAQNDGGIQLAKTVKAINRCVKISGALGGLITIILSYFLSKWTFGSSLYVLSFVLLSVVVFFDGVNGGYYATLQGVRRISAMAMARILGSFLNVVVALTFFYFYREKGIIPVLISMSLITCLISWRYVSKIDLPKVKQSLKETFIIGKSTIKLGMMMAITSISVLLIEFILKTFITNMRGSSDVGLYQAGWTLNSQYLGMVFTAMATDYFPRLSAISDDNQLLKKKVNEQAEIAVLILGPMITIMLIFMPFLIRLFYSDDFIDIVPMTRWLMVGSLIKAGSWAISFVFLAKGDGKTFLFNELGINLVILPTSLLGYYWLGIVGIGYAYTLNFIIYFIWVLIMASKKYNFSYSNVFTKLLSIQITVPLFTIFAITQISGLVMYVIIALLASFIIIYSFLELNKRLDIIQSFNIKFK